MLGLYCAVLTGRSLVHILAPDGGAESIATIDTDVEGGDVIIGMFAQWGLTQLMLAAVVWVVVLRYRGLVPLAALLVWVEPVLRIVVGQMKPIETVGTAPGATASYLLVPGLLVLLVASLYLRPEPPEPDRPTLTTAPEPAHDNED
ncbi:hypothetical protein [Nocardioides rubriscoriae]|uniref:hypothetical protein n=1 Tax=Nocardioides rubriscoriae TaxID=642762 RepID=UPI0011DF67D8|nr:hypothetical protein [Nocardioides rubriscoriae]